MATSTLPFTIPNSGSGYMKLPCGVLLQWGTIAITVSSNASRYLKKKGSATLTFSIEFSEKPRMVVTPLESGAWWNASCNTITTTTANVSTAGDTTGTRSVFWFAFGEWSE